MRHALALVVIVALSTVAAGALEAAGGVRQPQRPSKMSTEDAAKLDAALAHITIIMTKAQSETQPYSAEVQRICAAYKIDPARLADMKIDPKTGAITWPPPDPAPAVAAAPAPEKK